MGEWSADLPTKDGWYWAYEDYGNHFAIDFIRVEFSGRPDGEPLILSVEHDRQSDFELWDAWYGPVNPPDMSLSILSEIGHISEDCELLRPFNNGIRISKIILIGSNKCLSGKWRITIDIVWCISGILSINQ